MQGVRTSRGCVGCLRRKKGCDLQKPSCGRCRRLGVACTYEQRKYLFVTEDRHGSPRGKSPPKVDHPATWITSGSQKQLAQTDLDLQTEATFWKLYLPQEDPSLDGSIGGVLSAPWIPAVRILAQGDNFLRTAVYACAYAGVGWMRDDSSLVQRGLQLYARALQNTNTALGDPAQAQSDVVLACCRMLSVYEMFRRKTPTPMQTGSQRTDWQSHVKGTFRLVELRGRERHTSGHGLALFDGVRMPAVIFALARREPNSFTDLEWTPQWQGGLRDELFNLACTLPRLLQQNKAFVAAAVQPESTYQLDLRYGNDLVRRCVVISEKLKNWEIKAAAFCREAERDQPSEIVPGVQHSLVDVCKRHGYGFFFACTQYWAICVVLYSSARSLCRALAESGAGVETPTLPPWISPEPHLLNIAKTASHFFLPEAGLWAAQSAVFPLTTALFFLDRTGRSESEPYMAILSAFAANKPGTVVFDFVQSIRGAGRSADQFDSQTRR